MDAIHREKFISLLKDSVLALCKNGFIDAHGITRVDGLLGITLKSREVLLVNIGEELLPPAAHSRRSKEPELPVVDGVEEPPLKLAVAAENQSATFRLGALASAEMDFGRSEAEEVDSDVEGGNCREDKENLRGNVYRPGVAGPLLGKGENESDNDGAATIFESGRRDSAGMVDVSKPMELLHRAAEEFVGNSTGPTLGHLQNFNGNLTCQTTADADLALPWPNETIDGRLPGTIDPFGYLPLLGYRRPGSSSSAPTMPFPSLLPTFYDGSESIRALVSSARRRRHLRPPGHQTKKYCCDICDYKSNRSYNLLRHAMHVHAAGGCPCEECGAVFGHRMQLRAHRIEAHGDAGTGSAGYSPRPVKTEPKETVLS